MLFLSVTFLFSIAETVTTKLILKKSKDTVFYMPSLARALRSFLDKYRIGSQLLDKSLSPE